MAAFMGKCPKCGKPIDHVLLGFGSTTDSPPPRREVVTLCCPHEKCLHILSAQLDPIAIKSDIVAEVLAALKSGKK